MKEDLTKSISGHWMSHLRSWSVQTLLLYQVAKEAWPLAPSLTSRPSGDRDPLDWTSTCHLWGRDSRPVAFIEATLS